MVKRKISNVILCIDAVTQCYKPSSTFTDFSKAFDPNPRNSNPVTLTAKWAFDRFYLYKDGNEYSSTTGGWEIIAVSGSTLIKDSDKISWHSDGSKTYQVGIAQPKGAIDFSQYTRIGFEASMDVYTRSACSGFNDMPVPYIGPVWHSNKQTSWQDNGIVGLSGASFNQNSVGNTGKVEIIWDIPDGVKSKQYLHLRFGTSCTYSRQQSYLYKVWLEK